MTLTEFLLKLRETPRTWEFRNGGMAIRDGSKIPLKGRCPIAAVADLQGYSANYAAVPLEDEMGLPPIIYAADHRIPDTPSFAPAARLRQMLLWATGLAVEDAVEEAKP